ncbi:MAG TPA: methyltransferase, partial [Phenylobacterium sp.]|nr:methyltransferase [Phenylobacterium sp.]
SSGYVPQAYAVQLAKEAGFKLVAASEINANPKDRRDHPFGVWTLPPVRRSSPIGQPPDSKFDHTPYDAIGESDRMTLKFMKPR